MRVVFDTVVLVRGVINPLGSCGHVLHERRDRYQPVVSASIVTEYLTVLQRPTIVRKYGSPEPDALRPVLDLIASAIVVQPAAIPQICRDPKDDAYLATATAGSADYLVSEDNDLLALGRYEGIQIVTAEAFMRILDTDDDAGGLAQ